MSTTGHSIISTTDVNVFKRLANPAVVDVCVDSRVRRATAEMKQAIEQAAETKQNSEHVGEKERNPAGSPLASAVGSITGPVPCKTAFQRAQDKASEEVERVWATPVAPARLFTESELVVEPSPATCHSSIQPPRESRVPEVKVETGAFFRSERACPHIHAEAPPPKTTLPSFDAGENSDFEDDVEDSASEHWKPKDGQGKRLEKQGYIIELSNMRQKGVVLSREFTMNDSIQELEFEIQKQQNNTTTRQHVVFMRDMLKIGINGLEIANTRFGPFLSIDGWAESVTLDMNKYEPPLEKLYRRYFRRSQMSPIMELAWLLIGSMAAFHFKNKFFAPPATARASPEPEQDSKPTSRLRRPVSTETARKTHDRPKAGRPVLRPPSSIFGM
uniref:Uncharacterized protein n=1 Tax=viral metagenome TaxID=1070528 RepID=A0A6C0C1Q1_9ZZZZ